MLFATGVFAFAILRAVVAVFALAGIADSIATAVWAATDAFTRIGTLVSRLTNTALAATTVTTTLFGTAIRESALGLANAEAPGIAGITVAASAATSGAAVVAALFVFTLRLAETGTEVVTGVASGTLTALPAAAIIAALLTHTFRSAILASIPLLGAFTLEGLSYARTLGIGTTNFLDAHKDIGPLLFGSRGRVEIALVATLLVIGGA
jgi:hypothetical protein